MGIATYDVKEQYIGTGSLADYTFDFKIQSLSHLIVIKLNDEGIELWRVRGTDTTYLDAVAFDADNGGGTVTLIDDLETSYTLIILLANDEPVQLSEFKNKFDFTLKRIEDALDYNISATQRVAFLAQRAMLLHEFDNIASFNPSLPPGMPGQIGKIPHTNDAGTGWAPVEDWRSTFDMDATIAAALAAAQAAQDAADAAAASATAASDAAASTVDAQADADAAASSATAAANSASAAASSETNAAGSATAAAASATAAAGSATAAATSATAAANSATLSSGSAIASDASEVAALAAQVAAEAARDAALIAQAAAELAAAGAGAAALDVDLLEVGDPTTYPTGTIIQTPNATGADGSKSLTITSGQTDTGAPGNLNLYGGYSNDGQQGNVWIGGKKIVIDNAPLEFAWFTTADRDLLSGMNEGATIYNSDDDELQAWSGTIWEAIGTGSGGTVNPQLSNLVGPTAVNEDILPGVTDTIEFGSAALRFQDFYSKNISIKKIWDSGDGLGIGMESAQSITTYAADDQIHEALGDVALRSIGTGDAELISTNGNSVVESINGNIVLNPQIGTIVASGRKITSLGTPTNATDASTKGYVDGLSAPTITGTRALPQSIVAGTGIAFVGTAWNSTWYIQGSGGAVDVSANPQIAAGTSVGQRLRLIARSNTNTVKLEDGTGLDLNGMWIGEASSVLDLEWDGTNWLETNRR